MRTLIQLGSCFWAFYTETKLYYGDEGEMALHLEALGYTQPQIEEMFELANC